MKKYLTFILATFSIYARGQYFEPIGNGIGIDGVQSNATRVKSILNDTIHHKLLIGGEFLFVDSIPVNGGCAWDGNSYIPFLSSNSNIRMSSTMWNGYNVFAIDVSVHLFDSTQGIVFNFPPLISGSADIYDVISYNDTLYIGGGFYLQDGTYGLAKWNGTDWESVGGSITSGPTGNIQCLGVYNGDLIAAGTFDSIGGIAANHLARWDGAQWHAMGGGLGVSTGQVLIRDICEYSGDLYVTGLFNNVDGMTSPGGFAKWNGINWSIPSGYNGCNGNVLKVFHNKLYIGGLIGDGTPPAGSLGSYDGSNFQIFHSYNIDAYSLYAMDTFQNYLYLGGAFSIWGIAYP